MIEKISRDLRKAPPPKQLALGGVAGWAAGYLTMKVDIANLDGWTIRWLDKI